MTGNRDVQWDSVGGGRYRYLTCRWEVGVRWYQAGQSNHMHRLLLLGRRCSGLGEIGGHVGEATKKGAAYRIHPHAVPVLSSPGMRDGRLC